MPPTEAPQTHAEVAAAARSLRFPALLKPADAQRHPLPGGVKNVVIESADSLRDWYGTHPKFLARTVCQEIIPGGDDHMYEYIGLATQAGSVAVEASMRKLRQYLPGYGITSYGRTERCADVLAAGRALLEGVGWLGLASLEFKRSATDGRFYFIELNPRLPWYNHLLADAGVDFPVLAYRNLAGLQLPKPSPEQRDKVHWLNFELDVGAFWRLRQAGQLSVGSWLASLTRARSFAWLNPQDPAPMLAVLARLARLGLRRLWTR